MAYITQADITNIIDAVNLAGMTNDFGSDGSNSINTTVLSTILQLASDNADALVSSIYQVPFPVPPAKIKMASVIFACEMLYQRRLTPDQKNPMKPQGDFWRETLKMVNLGQLSLDEQFSRGFTPVVYNASKSRLDTNIF